MQRPKGEERRGASSREVRAILPTEPVAKRRWLTVIYEPREDKAPINQSEDLKEQSSESYKPDPKRQRVAELS